MESNENPRPIQTNLDLIAEFERDAQRRRTLSQRVSDWMMRGIGTIAFLGSQLIGLAIWVVVNLGPLGIQPFDPFPYGVLTLVFSAEGVFLAILVLISQNRMSADANRRAHLDLQMSLLTEQTSTKTLEMLRRISTQLGLAASDQEVDELAARTDVKRVMHELERHLPKS